METKSNFRSRYWLANQAATGKVTCEHVYCKILWSRLKEHHRCTFKFTFFSPFGISFFMPLVSGYKIKWGKLKYSLSVKNWNWTIKKKTLCVENDWYRNQKSTNNSVEIYTIQKSWMQSAKVSGFVSKKNESAGRK